MRDPRFEPAQLEIVGGCTAGDASTLRAHLLPMLPDAKPEMLAIDISRIDEDPRAHAHPVHLEAPRAPSGTTEIVMPPLAAGGYSARLRIGPGPTTRQDFACEVGGDEWADSRPDGVRLQALATATGGTFVWEKDSAARLPLPRPTVVSSERHVVPIAPPWAWTLAAAVALGAHWITRRRSGLS
jgi:hypothetical protein